MNEVDWDALAARMYKLQRDEARTEAARWEAEVTRLREELREARKPRRRRRAPPK